MSSIERWLQDRRPRPPEVVMPWLDSSGPAAGELYEELIERAREALERARAAPGPVRESAFHLLTADALLTYACETALETRAPAEALAEILRRTAA